MIEYVVSHAENGFRADKIVVNAFGDVSYTFLQKIFRTKKVKVNEKVAHASDRLKTGDIIKIFARKAAPSIRKDTQAKNDDTQVKMNLKSAEKFKQMIIFENTDFIAINKPTNLAVQKGSKVKICVEELMAAFNPDLKLVHRIDKDTSGILLIAKNTLSAQKLTRMFREEKIHKTYFAIVDGKIKSNGIIDNFLHKTMVGNEEKIQITKDDKSGQRAITKYFVRKIINTPGFEYYTLLELQPQTGRKHQLRVHCADALHAPILGDRKYNKHPIHKQLFLHAYKVEIDGTNIEITAKFPEYFPDIKID
ncbi:MAG: RluA family pseudouridine synthase [Alphaproteobacteria bacterium]|nr:RluA family pseudouridine synthase [Alphaproteobacteria bacterium]